MTAGNMVCLFQETNPRMEDVWRCAAFVVLSFWGGPFEVTKKVLAPVFPVTAKWTTAHSK